MMTLTDCQLAEITQAAELLPVNSRDAFLRSVANRLADAKHCNDDDVNHAITFVLSTRGVAIRS
jgi:hypothetical protein